MLTENSKTFAERLSNIRLNRNIFVEGKTLVTK